jgi:hypothetical protein
MRSGSIEWGSPLADIALRMAMAAPDDHVRDIGSGGDPTAVG